MGSASLMSTRAHCFRHCRSESVSVCDVLSAFTSHMTVTTKAIGLILLQVYIVYTLLKQLLLLYILITHYPFPEKPTIIIVLAEFLVASQPELLVSYCRWSTSDIKINRFMFVIHTPLWPRFSIAKNLKLLTLNQRIPNGSLACPSIINTCQIFIIFKEWW